MSLQADLSVKLDAGALVTGLLSDLGGPLAALSAISPPASGSQLTSAATGAASLDTGGLGATVQRIAQGAAPLLASLPGPATVLAPLAGLLALLEQLERLDGGRIGPQLQALADRLSAELSAPTGGGFLAALSRLAEALRAAPEGQGLAGLLQALLRAGGGALPAGAGAFSDALAAATGAVQAVGGLMALESVLADADRLTDLMASQVDPVSVQLAIDAAFAAFEVPSAAGTVALADRVRQLDLADPAAVGAALDALAAAQTRLAALADRVGGALGFGEATLTFLDVDKVQAELAVASAMVRGADLDPLERAMTSVAGLLSPLLGLDLSGVPSHSLADLLAAVEAKVAGFAATIGQFDSAALAKPLADGLGAVTGLLGAITAQLDRVTAGVRAALEQVRQAVAALPLDQIESALRAVLQPVGALLDSIRQLVAGIAAALGQAGHDVEAALAQAEQLVDAFKGRIEQLFAGARDFVEGLKLDQVVGEVAGRIKAFDDVLAKAQMQPYFDTAAGAIETAAGLIGAVPFALLPAAMKDQVTAAVEPIKDADAGAVQVQIESLLEIQDGKFALRADLTAAIAQIQAAYDQLLAEVRQHDPHQLVAQIDAGLEQLASRVRALSPGLTLAPIQEAVARVKAVIAGFDPHALLAPVEAVFTQVLAGLDEFSPARLLAPLQQRIEAVRARLVADIRLADWRPTLDALAAQAQALLARIDPAALEPPLAAALAEASALAARLPDLNLGGTFGGLFALLLSGNGVRIYPWTFEVVLGWLDGSGSSDLAARSARIADAVGRARANVAALDPAALAARLDAQVQAVKAAAAALSAGAGGSAGAAAASDIQLAAGRLDVAATAGALAANHARFRAALDRSASLADALRRTGLSEVDVATARLRQAFTPLAELRRWVSALAARIGLPGLDHGPAAALAEVLAVATPERLTALAMPLFTALHGRVDALLGAVLEPLQDGIAAVERLVAAVDLAPVIQGVDGVVTQVRQEIEDLRPRRLLAAPLAAAAALQAEVAAFDPLHDLLAMLDAVRAAVERVLGKLHAEAILASPLAIYDHVLGELGKLDLARLLSPVLDQLDALAAQVDGGLTRTVTAFQKLQQSLPGGGGGGLAGALAGGLSAGVSVGGAGGFP